jgi:LPS-assembly lipoprotein
MSWFERRLGAMLVTAALGACGFHPLYAEQSTLGYDPTLAAIDVRPAPDRIGQILVAALREQLNPRGAQLQTRYVLAIKLQVARSDLGIRRDNTSTRGELAISTNLILTDATTNQVVYRDEIRRITSFNEPDDAYAATVAEDNAREEAASDLGREIAERLALYVRQQQTGGKT